MLYLLFSMEILNDKVSYIIIGLFNIKFINTLIVFIFILKANNIIKR